MSGLTRDVAVAGVGYWPSVRSGHFDIREITLAACRAALEDAGLAPNDVDGIVQYSFGSDSPNAVGAQRLLGIENLHVFNDIMGSGPSGMASAMDASMAIASGACETVLV